MPPLHPPSGMFCRALAVSRRQRTNHHRRIRRGGAMPRPSAFRQSPQPDFPVIARSEATWQSPARIRRGGWQKPADSTAGRGNAPPLRTPSKGFRRAGSESAVNVSTQKIHQTTEKRDCFATVPFAYKLRPFPEPGCGWSGRRLRWVQSTGWHRGR